MKIKHIYKDMIENETVEYTVDDMTSPEGGYTQAYIERSGRDLEFKVKEQHDNYFLEWVSSELAA